MILSPQSIRKYNLVNPCMDRCEAFGFTFGLGPAGYDVRIAEDLLMPSRGFRLASTIEQFEMLDWVCAVVHDKSSWARRGLTVQNTFIEPGWRGYLTLELTNHSEKVIRLRKGHPIALVAFHMLDEPSQYPYSGKYQDQEAGPQQAR